MNEYDDHMNVNSVKCDSNLASCKLQAMQGLVP